MIKINSGKKRLFLVTFVLNLLLLILYNSILNVNVFMENEISQSTITRFNNNSYASISNFVTSSTKESLQASEKDEMCVYSLQNKTSNTYFYIMNIPHGSIH